MISESMAIKLNLKPGDTVDLSEPLGAGWQIVGVYYDYGNPYNQVMMSHANWLHAFAGTGDVALAIVLNEGAVGEKLNSRLHSAFHLDAERLMDISAIHRQAMRVFDRTFVIADTLGNITLLIAVCGIFFATLAGELSRQKHIALLRCLGVSGKELVGLGALQLFVFGLISMLIAMPLGLGLAKLVIDVEIRHSFGWTMELIVSPITYVKTAILSMLALIVAGALPIIRLLRKSPMKSLRDAL
jgi:putative ABC transport system permease protein